MLCLNTDDCDKCSLMEYTEEKGFRLCSVTGNFVTRMRYCPVKIMEQERMTPVSGAGNEKE